MAREVEVGMPAVPTIPETARLARKAMVLRKRLEGLCLLWEQTDPGKVALIRALLEETT
jgi:hypothetical protein